MKTKKMKTAVMEKKSENFYANKSCQFLKKLAVLVTILFSVQAFAADNLIKNPSAEDGSPLPAEWGRWKTTGKFGWGTTSAEFHTGKQCVFFQTQKFGDIKGRKYLGGAIIAANTDGTIGQNATICAPNTEYEFSFWMKGSLPFVEISVVGWKTDAAAKTDRESIKTSIPKIKPETEWKEYKGTFKTNEMTKRIALAFYVKGYEDEGIVLGKKIFIDDVKLSKK